MTTASSNELPVEAELQPVDVQAAEVLVQKLEIALAVDSDVVRNRLITNAMMSGEERDERRRSIRDRHTSGLASFRNYANAVRIKRDGLQVCKDLGGFTTRLS